MSHPQWVAKRKSYFFFQHQLHKVTYTMTLKTRSGKPTRERTTVQPRK